MYIRLYIKFKILLFIVKLQLSKLLFINTHIDNNILYVLFKTKDQNCNILTIINVIMKLHQ